jgi:SecD/SecF fusion protein
MLFFAGAGMNKNLFWKNILIIILALFAAWTLYPPNKTLKPGIDLAGGTSLIYEIDTQGLTAEDKKGLSERMITILRRRIDPANIQNLVWRPQGNTRFEIQMPLASAEARQKRQHFEKVLGELIAENVNPALIMRSLATPSEERRRDFEEFAQGSEGRVKILDTLASAYDKYTDLRTQSDSLRAELKSTETTISEAGLDLEQIKENVNKWIGLDEENLTEMLKMFLGSDDNLELLSGYVNTYGQWAGVVTEIIEPETGAKDLYKAAKKDLDELSLTKDQINFVLEMPLKSSKRFESIENFKVEFADRAKKIDAVVKAYDEYYPFRGGLDDPKDLQRMLKGAGILEFRILPTTDRSELTPDEIEIYKERIKTKGPRFASDIKYVWCELENIEEWNQTSAIVEPFGNKYYVLASNKDGEAMLHATDAKERKLKSAVPGQDREGRRAINFVLDERAGLVFARITGQNIGRPLCILLDGIAISAPFINSKIFTHGQITGSFSETEVRDMVNKLNAGSLPARLIEQPISVKTIGPSIGADNRDKGIKAGLIGFVLVAVCIGIYYTLAGTIADLALFLNLLFVLAIMAFVKANFTLPGIAGIILTIGMSVDANVLIFERIREEQQRGSSLRIAIKNGYQKAFSAIIDSNITTFITAAILFWVASEEIKGFAIVLMLGIVSSMFTALFVTRTNFDSLLVRRLIKDHLLMLRIIHKPKINWMAARPVFLTTSTLLITGGLFVFFTRDDLRNNKYDIEFTGGTSVQVNLRNEFLRQEVEDRIRKVGSDLGNAALAVANVYSVGKTNKQYEINTTETNKTSVTITFPKNSGKTTAQLEAALGDKLTQLSIAGNSSSPDSFVITTSQTNQNLVESVLTEAFAEAEISEMHVDEVVNGAILTAFANELEVQQDLRPHITAVEKITEGLIDSYPELADFLGGLKLTCDIERAATAEEVDTRFKDLRFKPDMRNLEWYSYKIVGPELNEIKPNQMIRSFVYLSVEPEAAFREITDDQWKRFVDNETKKVLSAARLETSLPRVTQVNPSIGAEAKTQALIAIVLSLIAIITYVWVRFGDLRYGLAAIVALVHDVCITLGAVTVCTYIAGKPVGQAGNDCGVPYAHRIFA